MSGESEEHTILVSQLSDFVRKQHGGIGNLALYVDDQALGRERPQRIGNHLPDLYAEDVPRTFVVIGEAKTRLDLITSRSRQQISAFVDYLALHKAAFFYLAVPVLATPAANAFVRELGDRHVRVNMHVLPVEIEY
ncbi:hypothetical protein [uncultured Roseobacter sp.]|uniref:hypothetical protein n=1 Tax=uncultured Roseobacter sp. TaxID=114847 RepID=UPI00261F4060|nr:hypothetical protein [uncultured Roseobacter sp.]